MPDHPEASERYHHSKEILSKRRFVGPVHLFEAHSALTQLEVRERFAVEAGQRVIYLTGGGGSDSRDFLWQTARNLARDKQNFVLVGWGPLHQGECIFRRNLVSLTGSDMRELFSGVDAALSAAGYNTYQELLAAGVPTVFYAQEKGMDRQDERVALGVEKGWHSILVGTDPQAACDAVNRLFEDDVRESIATSLAARAPARGRWKAAAEILALHGSLPGSPVNRALLYLVAGWQRAWSGPRFCEIAVWARRWLKHACTPEALEGSRLLGLLFGSRAQRVCLGCSARDFGETRLLSRQRFR